MKGAYAVFGAGSFGSKVAAELSEAGHHVVVVDCDREAVMAIREKVTEALVADVSNPDVIRELDVKKFDGIIMGMSSHFEDLILALTLIKQEGAKNIYVKSNSAIQKKILLRLGADHVIQPDQDVAERLLKINPALAEEARKVLDLNKQERHLRGGLATKEKYLHMACK